jgi:hypothetical protein
VNVPVVLPVVHVKVAADGGIAVDVDGTPRDAGRALERAHLRGLLDQLTVELDSPVRVEIHEHDGTTYSDIAMPPPEREEPERVDSASFEGGPGLTATGFHAGEELALAYVVARPRADDTGSTSLHLPPTLLAANRGALLLLGTSSGRIATLT